MLSKKAWGSWTGVLAVVIVYGILVKESPRYYVIMIIALTLGLVPLYVLDRIYRRRDRRRER